MLGSSGSGGLEGVHFHIKWGPGWYPLPIPGRRSGISCASGAPRCPSSQSESAYCASIGLRSRMPRWAG